MLLRLADDRKETDIMIGRHTAACLAIALALSSATHLYAQERLPPIPADRMTEAQKKVAADFEKARQAAPTGPFAVMLRVPELMDLSFKWRQHVQARNVLSQKQAEFIILLTAREWTQQYEWNAHYPAAIQAGLTPEVTAAIADGRRPERLDEELTILYDLCTELQQRHSVSDATYARALAKFGEPGIVEATSMVGYYAMLAMVMNTARTPVPEGAKPPLAAFPR
jgi:4-carboxymuconolactone decarboxylase